jgi:CelD/BcsL family acetyltransferase involved in cellulose biosynthesis
MTERQLPLERVDDIDVGDGSSIEAEWGELARASRNIFGTPEFLKLWWRHAETGAPMRLSALRAADGSITAVLPIYVQRRGPIRIARFLGHGPGDELGPVHRPADATTVARGLQAHLDARRDWDVVLAEHLPGASSWPAALGGELIRHEGSPVLQVAGRTWDEILASRSPNFRQQVRRHARRLRSRHEVDLRLTTSADTIDADLDDLFRLHRARWGRESRFPGRWEAFYREFAHVAFEAGWLRLWTMRVDGAAGASWLGFRFSGAECYYQAGRDPALEDARVGFVLLCHTVEAAVGDGVEEYRFLRGDEAFKGRFATEDLGLDSFLVARGVMGRVGAAGLAVGRALPPRARAGIRRIVG